MNISRRDMVKLAAWFAGPWALNGALAQTVVTGSNKLAGNREEYDKNGWALENESNFKAIYGNPKLKEAFLQFLTNVYHLFPQDSFHRLIEEVTLTGSSDKEIYRRIQSRLKEVTPLLGEFRYALPALAQQKAEMARETMALLGSSRKINGYLEIGTTGRYISKFKSSVQLSGEVLLLHTDQPTYSPTDIVERAQLRKLGRYVPLNDYAPVASSQVGDASIDLITNFIGFHHSPPAKRDAFVASLHRVLRPGGRMIVRDHDVNSGAMNHLVALAHDVFNMGLGADWSVNQTEIRNFTSLAQLSTYIEGFGFKRTAKTLFQPGDPTQNALMEFART
jgi:hypothetical protein